MFRELPLHVFKLSVHSFLSWPRGLESLVVPSRMVLDIFGVVAPGHMAEPVEFSPYDSDE